MVWSKDKYPLGAECVNYTLDATHLTELQIYERPGTVFNMRAVLLSFCLGSLRTAHGERRTRKLLRTKTSG